MLIPRRSPYFPNNIIKLYFDYFTDSKKVSHTGLLKTELEKKLNLKNVIPVVSGRIGLYLILKYSGLKKGSNILIPGYTFGTLNHFIRKAGFVPNPVDIDADTFQMSVDSVKKAINKNTGAILATHIFGEPCDIVSIKKIASQKNILLIEDCAESLGAEVAGRATGMFGDVALSSFNVAKPLHGFTGGIVFGNNNKILKKINEAVLNNTKGIDTSRKEVIRGLIGIIANRSIFWPVLMYLTSYEKFRQKFVKSYRSKENKQLKSFVMPDYIAFLILKNLEKYKVRLEKRNRIKKIYHNKLGRFVTFQKQYKKSTGNGYMVVGTIKKDPILLRRYLSLKGIDIAIKEEIADDIVEKKGSITEKIHTQAIALPIYENLSSRDIDRVALSIKNFLQK